MIQIFQTAGKRLVEQSNEFSGGINIRNKWIHLENPTDREIELIERVTGVSEDMLKAALDVEERARIELDEGDMLVLFDIPTIEDEDSYYSYSTMPLGVVITDNCVITVCLKENSIISNLINNRIKNLDTAKRENFLYQMLYNTHVKFLQYLRQIDRSWQRIQVELHRSTKNKELIQLLTMEKSLVYFTTSLKSTEATLEKLLRGRILKFSEEDQELLEDVIIEFKQAIEMADIYSSILSGTMDAFASVISNNLNIIMKVLTVITILMTVPNVVFSFYGMNTDLPIFTIPGTSIPSYWLPIVLAVVFTGVSWLFMKKRNLL